MILSIILSSSRSAAVSFNARAADLLELKIIDKIIPEPLGGAHRDPQKAAENIKATILESLNEISNMDTNQMVQARYDKFRNMGKVEEAGN